MPSFGVPGRVVGSSLAAVAIFMGASVYTVATASAALPGDWQYPIKLETERVRVALAFSDEAKRDVKLDIAEERVSEIQQLARRGRIIGPGVLDRLVEQTQPLVDDAREGGWDPDEAARLEAVTEKQQEVLAASSWTDRLERAGSAVGGRGCLEDGPGGLEADPLLQRSRASAGGTDAVSAADRDACADRDAGYRTVCRRDVGRGHDAGRWLD